MSIKERPLIKAVERAGPLPGFLDRNPIFAGFFSMLMCPVFGAGFVMFWSLYGKALETFEAMRVGAIVATSFASLIFFGIFMSAIVNKDERAYRLQFFLGGALCVVMLIAVDYFSVDWIREYLAGKGYLVCTTVVQGCD